MPAMSLSRQSAGLIALALITLWVAGPAGPARSASEEEVEAARRAQQEAAAARAAALTDLNDAAAAYEEINGEYQELVSGIDRMGDRIDAYQMRITDLREDLRQRAVEAYMRGPEEGTSGMVLESSLAQEALVAREFLAWAVDEQAALLSSLEAATGEMERLEVELEGETTRAVELRIEAEAVAGRMYELLAVREAELDEANQTLWTAEAALAEQHRQEELERLRREALRRYYLGPAGGVPDEITPGFVCPVAGSSVFVDSWGAPRYGGRVHTGTDLMGARGTPLVAAADGAVQLGNNPVGGNTVWLYADHGVAYFYAHLDGFAPISSGQWVSRGTLLGYMGDTGNPAPGAYHLHFAMTPAGMGAVNPYPTLLRHCD
jgi:murein DD-endopeptidase MepM/ murein hydrolase activator NlpD